MTISQEKFLCPSSVSRRDVLKSLAVGVSAGAVLAHDPLQAAEQVHRMVTEERAQAAGGAYTPKFFPAHAYQTLRSLCQTIIPPDRESRGRSGSRRAGVHRFADQREPGVPIDPGWRHRLARLYLQRPVRKDISNARRPSRKRFLTRSLIVKVREKDPTLGPGVKFFSLLRDLTTDGFFTSKIGIKYLEYIGNTYLAEFPGCPPLPEG